MYGSTVASNWVLLHIWPEASYVKPSFSLVKQVMTEVQVLVHLSIQNLLNGLVGRARKTERIDFPLLSPERLLRKSIDKKTDRLKSICAR